MIDQRKHRALGSPRTVFLGPLSLDSTFLGAVFGTLLALTGCDVESQGGDTGGLGGAQNGLGGAAGSPSEQGCPSGVVALLSDYASTQIALVSLAGDTLSESLISTASTETDGLAFALSGDVTLPSAMPPSGLVVLLDRYGTNVVTWVDPYTGRVLAQLPVGTGFESNPQDYLEIDEKTAWVTRWGQNHDPGTVPYDTGGDILIIDLSEHSIRGGIVIPERDDLPPRPGPMSRVGSEVWVTLGRISTDFSVTGEAELVAFDATTGKRQESFSVAGRKNCGRLTPSPDRKLLALACSGELDPDGNVTGIRQSAVLLFDGRDRPLRQVAVFEAEDVAGEPLQPSLSFADDGILLLKTQTVYFGETNNRLLSLELDTAEVHQLLEAGPRTDGSGKGIVFGDLFCSPGCSDVCLMADADTKKLQRLKRQDGRWRTDGAVAIEQRVGLPPVTLTGF